MNKEDKKKLVDLWIKKSKAIVEYAEASNESFKLMSKLSEKESTELLEKLMKSEDKDVIQQGFVVIDNMRNQIIEQAMKGFAPKT